MNIWDRLLRRPDPVQDVHDWFNSKESNEYLLAPYSSLEDGSHRRSRLQSDSLIISSVAIPYKAASKRLGFNPKVFLPKENKSVPLKSLSNSSVITHDQAGVVTLLDNSYLVGAVDDNHLKDSLLSHMEEHVSDSLTEQTGVYDVLCKTETILLGKTNRLTNRQVIDRFLELTIDSPQAPLDKLFGDRATQVSARLITIVSGMNSRGLILQKSEKDFTRAILSLSLDPLASGQLIQFYKESIKR